MRWRVPRGWRWTTVGEIAEVVGGGTPTASDPTNFDEAGVPWITPADLSGYSGTYIERGSRSLSQKGYAGSGARLMPSRAVLFSSRAPIGYCVIARQPVATNQGFKSLVLKDGVLSEYVRHYLLGSKRYIEDLASGTTFKEISGRRMAEVEVPIAPIDEQHRIVAAIETHFSRLDAAVASLTRAKANVKRARASVLKAAVEGRLVPTEAALARAEGREVEPAAVLLDRILAERKAAWAASGARGKYKEPVKPETEGLPGLPEGWCWATLEQMGSWSSGGTPSRTRADYYNGDIPWVKTGELLDKDIRETEEQITQAGLDGSSAKVFPSGTLLVAMYGATIGMTGRLVVPAATNQACAALLPNAGNAAVLPYLWKFTISQRPEFRKVGQGGAQPNISQTIIKAWPVAVPPLAEQHRIVAEVDRRLSVLDALDATLDANLARCDRLRQAVLKRAFEGRLVPAEADAPLLAAEPQMPLFAQDARS